MAPDNIREQYNLPASPYFLSHSVGCLSLLSETLLAENFLAPWKTSGGDAWGAWLNLISDFDLALTDLLGSEPQYFCPQQNLSSGFTKFLMALPQPINTKNKVLMHPDAFPSMGFVVKAMEKMGLELKYVKPSQPESQLQMWQEAIDEDTYCALITHAHSNTGVVSPVSDIVELCSEKAIYSVVDIAQSVGVLPISLSDWNADLVLGSCVKWLCGGPGAGFLWVNPNILSHLNPIDVGWFSHQNPFQMEIESFEYSQSAKRFWGGTPSIAPYATALGGIRTTANIGVENILQHNRLLMEKFLSSTQHVSDYTFETDAIGGTLCLPVKPAVVDDIDKSLKAQKIFFDRRQNVIRLSFHIYNNESDCDQLSETFNAFK